MIFISDHSIVVKVLVFYDINGKHPRFSEAKALIRLEICLDIG